MTSASTADHEPVAGGFAFCEAARVADDGAVWFSDLTGGGLHSVSGGTVTTRLAGRRWIGGVTFDQGGAAVVSGEGGLILLNADGTVRPLLSDIAGAPITAVNDIEADERGGLFGGTIDFAAILERGAPPAPGRLFHLATDGTLTVLRDDVAGSNGIAFSPDGRLLYHAETTVGLWEWRRDAGGMPVERKLLVPLDDCDGVAVDVEGHVWVAFWQQAVLVRFRPDGGIERRIALSVPHMINLAFGGADRRDLYVTTGASSEMPDAGGVIRLRVDVPGLPAHRSRFAEATDDGP